METDANIEVVESSPTAEEQDANTVESSSTEASTKVETFESVVDQAFKEVEAAEEADGEGSPDQDKPEETTEAPPAEGETTEATANTEESDGETKVEEEEEQVPFHEHPRWQEKLQELVDEKAANDSLRQDRTDNQVVLDQVNLVGKDQFDNFLQFRDMMQTDPKAALEMILPTVNGLMQQAGLNIAPDLQAQIDEGTITEVHAKELQSNRARITQLEKNNQTTITRNADQQQIDISKRMVEVANHWGSAKSVSDPDYAKKEELIVTHINAAKADRTFPTSERDVSKFLEGIHAKVTKMLVAPTKTPPVAKKTVASAGTGHEPPKEHATILEVVSAGLEAEEPG